MRELPDLAFDIADALVRADDRGLIATSGDILPLRKLLDAWREATDQPFALGKAIAILADDISEAGLTLPYLDNVRDELHDLAASLAASEARLRAALSGEGPDDTLFVSKDHSGEGPEA